MTKLFDLKDVIQPTDFVKQIYEIQNNRLLEWRERYDKQVYPYKVGVNTIYQMLTCKEMWSTMMIGFQKNKLFDKFTDAYEFIQNKSGEIAKKDVLPNLESSYKSLSKVSVINMDKFRQMVLKAQEGSNEFNSQVEHAYIWYTGSVELIYGWVSLGLLGYNMLDSMFQLFGIMFGGNNSEMDTAITNFGQIMNASYVSLEDLW